MLGSRIAVLRRRAGFSQAQLARRLQISASAMGMYEQGRREPSADTLVAIARELQVSTDFLLTGQSMGKHENLDASSFFGYDSPKGGDTVEEDLRFMDAALQLAAEAAAEGEVPVGCVIVRHGEIVGRGRNRRETKKTALGHAEIEAIHDACTRLGGWRLWECTLYVTLEPCPMCAGAIVNARIPRVVFGASDQKCGACGSVCDLFSMDFNHHPAVEQGVREEEAAALLSDFFQQLRVELRSRPKWKRPEHRENER